MASGAGNKWARYHKRSYRKDMYRKIRPKSNTIKNNYYAGSNNHERHFSDTFNVADVQYGDMVYIWI